MTRSFRNIEPGGVYHITARGNDRRPIVLDDDDRTRFHRVLATTAESLRWGVLAWCLMNNHHHLVLHDPLGNLVRGMQRMHASIAVAHRRRHGGTGHLFQGRYALRSIRSAEYLVLGVRYTLRNPVEAGLVTRAEEWPWSSARATLGLEAAPRWLRVDNLYRRFDADPARARAAIRELLE